MTNEEYAEYRRIRTKCDELALAFFENADDLAAVSFQCREVISRRLEFVAGRGNDEATD